MLVPASEMSEFAAFPTVNNERVDFFGLLLGQERHFKVLVLETEHFLVLFNQKLEVQYSSIIQEK